jgi:hypothetical protein
MSSALMNKEGRDNHLRVSAQVMISWSLFLLRQLRGDFSVAYIFFIQQFFSAETS